MIELETGSIVGPTMPCRVLPDRPKPDFAKPMSD